jgi:hypothetical protein
MRLTRAVQAHGEANWKSIAAEVQSRSHVQVSSSTTYCNVCCNSIRPCFTAAFASEPALTLHHCCLHTRITVPAALEEGAEAWPCQGTVEQGGGCKVAAASREALLQELGLPSAAHGGAHF